MKIILYMAINTVWSAIICLRLFIRVTLLFTFIKVTLLDLHCVKYYVFSHNLLIYALLLCSLYFSVSFAILCVFLNVIARIICIYLEVTL